MLYTKRHYAFHPLKFFRFEVVRPVINFTQRGRRGWSDEDARNIDYYLSKTVPGMLRQMQDRSHGTPMTLNDDEWHAVLEEIAIGFESVQECWDVTSEAAEKFETITIPLFGKWFLHLWT